MRLWIPIGVEHAHEALGRFVGELARSFKTDCGMDEIAQDGLSGYHLAEKQALDALLERLLKEGRVMLDVGLDRRAARPL